MAEAPELAANLTLLFTELPFLERFGAAARAGFTSVEVQFPYAWPVESIHDELKRHGLTLALLNLPAGDWAAGERGIACHPDRVTEFDAGLVEAIRYATALGCPLLNCLAGVPPEDVDRATALATLGRNLRVASAQVAAAGLSLVVEPINTHDVPGFLLATVADFVQIRHGAGLDGVSLQLDVYHVVMMKQDPVALLARYGGLVRHVQIADAPGRHEPGTGAIDFEALLAALATANYQGRIGCEYNPIGRTEDGLGWMGPYLASRRTR